MHHHPHVNKKILKKETGSYKAFTWLIKGREPSVCLIMEP
jgi:hypothetical protein